MAILTKEQTEAMKRSREAKRSAPVSATVSNTAQSKPSQPKTAPILAPEGPMALPALTESGSFNIDAEMTKMKDALDAAKVETGKFKAELEMKKAEMRKLEADLVDANERAEANSDFLMIAQGRLKSTETALEHKDKELGKKQKELDETKQELADAQAAASANVGPKTPSLLDALSPPKYGEIIQKYYKVASDWVKSKMRKLIAAVVVISTIYGGAKYAQYQFEVYKAGKAAQARLLQEKKAKEVQEKHKAKMAEARIKALEAREVKVKAKTAEILQRCAPATQPIAAVKGQPAQPIVRKDPVLCLTPAESERWKSTAESFRNGKNFKDAGLSYLEFNDLNEASKMADLCNTQKQGCENELREAMVVMGEALKRVAKTPKNQ